MHKKNSSFRSLLLSFLLIGSSSVSVLMSGCTPADSQSQSQSLQTDTPDTTAQAASAAVEPAATLDTAEYNAKVAYLSRHDTTALWPVKASYPLPGAVLPYKRIIAYYGNLYSKQMGILGELPPNQMMGRLMEEVKKMGKSRYRYPCGSRVALHCRNSSSFAAKRQNLPPADAAPPN